MRHRVLAFVVGGALLFGSLLSLRAAVKDDPKSDTITVELKDFKFKVKKEQAELFKLSDDESKLCYYANGPAEATVKVPTDGEYEILIKASCDPAKNERAKFKLSIDKEAVGKETLLTYDGEKEYKLTAKLKKGERTLVIEFTNDDYKENEYDRNLYIHGVTLKPVKK